MRRSVVNDGKPMAMLPGRPSTSAPTPPTPRATPRPDPVKVEVVPPDLAAVTGSPTSGGTSADLTLTAGSHPGDGWLFRPVGRRRSLQAARSPSRTSHGPWASRRWNRTSATEAPEQFGVTGTAPSGTPLTTVPRDATWTVTHDNLGMVSADGLFTAAASGDGLAMVIATAGGSSASTARCRCRQFRHGRRPGDQHRQLGTRPH